MSQSRRNFIKMSSLASFTFFSAIGFLLESYDEQEIKEREKFPNPLRIEPTRLVDAHIHLFNARYLPLKSIINKVPIITTIAGPTAKLLYALTDDFSMDDSSMLFEDDKLKTMQRDELIDWFIDRTSKKIDDIANKSGFNEIDKSFEKSQLITSIAELAKEMNKEQKNINSFNKKKFVEQYKQSHSIAPNKNAKVDFENMYSDPVRWTLKKISTPNVDLELQQYLDCDGIPVINFLAIMLTNEAKIYNQAKSGYGNANLVLQVHYMMDMQASYKKGYTYYPFHPIQTTNMMKLVNHSNGKLLGFTAFNPKNKDNAMKSFQDGIAAGNIGVKFYPPMGYKPFGDSDADVRSKVADFFTYCETHQIPVFTHCTPMGFQVEKGSGLNSDPKYWELLLEEHPDLRICFGHAGGGEAYDYHGWYSTPEQWNKDCYARKVVELCEKYPNVYCEVAHLEKIINNIDNRQRFINNLVENFDGTKRYKLKDKICFGTDWNMIGMINEQQHYYEVFVNIFQDQKLRDNIDNFFSKNFINFLNIRNFLSKKESDYLSQESRQYLENLLI